MTTPAYDFTGTAALVTGATGGMGRAITAALVEAGAQVMASDLSDAAGRDLLADVAVEGSSLDFACADVGEPAQVEALVARTVERFGGLHYAVNAAAIEFETVPLADCAPTTTTTG